MIHQDQHPPSPLPDPLSPASIDERIANATPPLVLQVVDGWLLRWNQGVTRRGNSVLPSGDRGAFDLVTKLRYAEEFYRRRGMPCRFQITAAASPALVALLDEQGYNVDGPTLVQTATVADVLARSAESPHYPIETMEQPSGTWLSLDGAGESAAYNTTRRAMFERIGPPTCYALARIDDTPAAIAYGVLERDTLGVYGVATLAQFRRRGASTALLRALTHWATERGASHLYLAVSGSNTAARSVYARAGFEIYYTYHYREAPPR